MELTEQHLAGFYRDCEYWPSSHVQPRPNELNIPERLCTARLSSQPPDEQNGKRCVYNLDGARCKELAPILLHESLFHFYKAFYNYLAARALYFGGMEHWAFITLYYAKFYIARSVTTLAGKKIYEVRKDDNWYDSGIASFFNKRPNRYRISMGVDIPKKAGSITFDLERINSHKDAWNAYGALRVQNMGLYPVADERREIVDERNRENYSFDGYMLLDFNSSFEYFENFFKRDVVKPLANVIYDEYSGGVLTSFSSQFRLYERLGVNNLPIERRKLASMIGSSLPDSEAKTKLLDLCAEGFPTENLYSADGNVFADERGREL